MNRHGFFWNPKTPIVLTPSSHSLESRGGRLGRRTPISPVNASLGVRDNVFLGFQKRPVAFMAQRPVTAVYPVEDYLASSPEYGFISQS